MQTKSISALVLTCVLVAMSPRAALADPGPLNTSAIGAAAGTAATAQADGVVRIGWKRDEVPVTIDGLKFPPPAGLGSWAAFKALPDGCHGDGRHGGI